MQIKQVKYILVSHVIVIMAGIQATGNQLLIRNLLPWNLVCSVVKSKYALDMFGSEQITLTSDVMLLNEKL